VVVIYSKCYKFNLIMG